MRGDFANASSTRSDGRAFADSPGSDALLDRRNSSYRWREVLIRHSLDERHSLRTQGGI